MFHVPNKYRITDKRLQLASDDSFGNNGAFEVMFNKSLCAICIASDQLGWEHVSLHMVEDNQCETPIWDEMNQIKDLFWDEEDTVIQFHPPKSEYINQHENVLHLWRKIGFDQPLPPTIMV